MIPKGCLPFTEEKGKGYRVVGDISVELGRREGVGAVIRM